MKGSVLKFSVPSPKKREDIEVGLAFPEDSAGRRMQTDVVSVGTNWTVGQTIDYLREESDLPEEFLDLFVVDEEAARRNYFSSRILRSPRNTLMRGNSRTKPRFWFRRILFRKKWHSCSKSMT